MKSVLEKEKPGPRKEAGPKEEKRMNVDTYMDQITARTANFIDSLILVGHLPIEVRTDAIIEVDRIVDTFLQGDKEENK